MKKLKFIFFISIKENLVMDGLGLDENDLLHTNSFITHPIITSDLPEYFNDDFKELFKESLNKEMKTANYGEVDENEEDSNSFSRFERNDSIQNGDQLDQLKTIDLTTIVNIDSRDRDTLLYSRANYFKTFLGKTFTNIVKIKLSSIEFPNTNAVINSKNNKIYWINQEDIDNDIIDTITGYYPIYNVELRIGSYLSNTLKSEMINKMNNVKRRNGISSFHYFDIVLDTDTDIVTFTSLKLTQLSNNPISTTTGTGTVRVTFPNHGFESNDIVYIIGAKTTSGISGSSLNGNFSIVKINNNEFQYELNINAGETSTGGGNTVKIGRTAPFKFLFGADLYPNTVAPNLGFPIENSSERINSYIKSIDKFYQAQITLASNHNLTISNIGELCNLNNTLTSPDIDGPRVITQIINSTTLLITMNTSLNLPSFNNGTFVFNSTTLNILSIANHITDTVIITTFSKHNLEISSINTSIILSNTITTPSLDGNIQISSILSDTILIAKSSITVSGGSDVLTPGLGGEFAYNNPLKTHTNIITNIIINSLYTIIESPNHNLKTNDNIQFFNTISSPSLVNKTLLVINIIDSNTFIINSIIDSFNPNSLLNAYFGSGKITITFPDHSFNNISNIYNDILPNTILIDTLLPHSFTSGDKIRISNSNSTPSINGSYTITVIDSDTFSIIFPTLSLPGTYGLLGLNTDFYLYSSSSIGGVDETFLNNIRFFISDIIDKDTFVFTLPGNVFATRTEIGGNNNVYISSNLHGFFGIQDNTKNNILNRNINLQGESYALLCSPQLTTIVNTGQVNNIFARILLDQSPNTMCFNFLSTPKKFDLQPLNKLDELEISVYNYDNVLYEFNNLDYSLALEITERLSTTNDRSFNNTRVPTAPLSFAN
jgi:hypothetical protein